MKPSAILLLLAGGLFLAGLVVTSFAQEPADQMPPDVKAAMEKAKEQAAGGDEKKKKKDEYPPFEEVTEGFKQIKPEQKTFFTLWFNEKTDELLCQIPKGLLSKRFLAATTLSGGSPMSGAQAGHTLLFWEQFGKQLLLVEPDLRYAPGEKSTVADVIKRTYNDTILKSVPIKTLHSSGDPVIDLGDLLKSGLPGMGGMPIDAKLSKWGEFKVFEKNVELPVELAIRTPTDGPGGRPGAGAASSGGVIEKLVLHYSMSELPDNPGYKPRRADDRLGYFLTVNKDWSKKHNEKTLFNRFINRWDLQKVDPELALSPVKRPIIWYVEKTVPIRWRRYVKEGILDWNKAFEKCGFVDAVQVRQQTDTEFADLHPGDVRYNFFRWIVSGRAFAMGPSRANPLTGEILDADIIMDDSMVRVWTQRYGIYGKKATFWEDEDPTLLEFLAAHPDWNFQERTATLLPQTAALLAPQKTYVETLLEDLDRRSLTVPQCSYAEGIARELAFDAALAKANGEEDLPEEFLGQIIKEVVSHEVGHCLGLRHNFKASTYLTLEEALAHSDRGAANCGSVMDYNPTLFSLKEAKQGDYVMRTIGPYDHWAIEYGYRPVEKPFKNEEELLKSITDRVADRGLAYGTDEDTMFFSPDPLCNRYDFGTDPTAYARHQMTLVEQLRDGLTDWAVEDGESYYQLRRTFNTLLSTYGRDATYVARFVGGMYVNRDHKADPNARSPFEVVPAARQREALEFISEHLFSDKAWRFPPELLNKLAAGRFSHWDSDQFDLEVEFPIHETVARIQYGALFQFMNPWTVKRIYDTQMQCVEDAFTLSELMGKLAQEIWSELAQPPAGGLYSDAEPFISSFRRGLQRQHLRLLVNIALQDPDGTLPADAHALTTMTLQDLNEMLGEALKKDRGKTLDSFTRAHLMDSKKRIEKALDAVYNMRS